MGPPRNLVISEFRAPCAREPKPSPCRPCLKHQWPRTERQRGRRPRHVAGRIADLEGRSPARRGRAGHAAGNLRSRPREQPLRRSPPLPTCATLRARTAPKDSQLDHDDEPGAQPPPHPRGRASRRRRWPCLDAASRSPTTPSSSPKPSRSTSRARASSSSTKASAPDRLPGGRGDRPHAADVPEPEDRPQRTAPHPPVA